MKIEADISDEAGQDLKELAAIQSKLLGREVTTQQMASQILMSVLEPNKG